MSAQAHHSISIAGHAGIVGLDDADAVSGIIEAGLRARGVADACERAGMAAVLLDRFGRVLHIGRLASGLLGGDLRIESGHVLGSDALANVAIATVLNPILGVSAGKVDDERQDVIVSDMVDCGSVVIAASAYADGLPGQLLKAILFIDRDGAGLAARAATLRWRTGSEAVP